MADPISIKIDAGEVFPHLSKAPITEAAIGIRANAQTEWTEEVLRQRLREKLADYPDVHSERAVFQEWKIEPFGEPEQRKPTISWRGLRCSSDDGRQLGQFYRDSFSFNRLYPYTHWQEFCSEAIRLLEIHNEIAQLASVHRIDVRFINRIEVPIYGLDVNKYLTIAPREITLQNHLPLLGFFHQETLAVPGHPYAVTLTRTIQAPLDAAKGTAGVILDIDVFTLKAMEFDLGTIADHLQKMRWVKNKIFFASITPTLLSELR